MNPIVFRTILTVICIMMLNQAIKQKDRKVIWLTAGLTLTTFLIWVSVSELIWVRVYLFLIILILTFFYGIFAKNIALLSRGVILLSAGAVLIEYLMMLLHWPGANLITLFFLIPLSLFTISVFKKLNLKPEFSFVVILNMYMALSLLSFL